MKNEKIEKILNDLAGETLPNDAHKIADDVSKKFKSNLTKTNITLLERIMNNPMTKYVAAAAVLIIVVFAGAQIFTESGERNTLETVLQPDIKTPTVVQTVNNVEPELKVEPQIAKPVRDILTNVRRMFASGDADGLVEMLTQAEYGDKIAASIFLAKAGDAKAVDLLKKLSLRWEGTEATNPFAAAIKAVETKEEDSTEQMPLQSEPTIEVEPVVVSAQETPNKADDKIDLKLSLQKGQKFGMLVTTNQKIIQTINGQEMKMGQLMTIGLISEVLETREKARRMKEGLKVAAH